MNESLNEITRLIGENTDATQVLYRASAEARSSAIMRFSDATNTVQEAIRVLVDRLAEATALKYNALSQAAANKEAAEKEFNEKSRNWESEGKSSNIAALKEEEEKLSEQESSINAEIKRLRKKLSSVRSQLRQKFEQFDKDKATNMALLEAAKSKEKGLLKAKEFFETDSATLEQLNQFITRFQALHSSQISGLLKYPWPSPAAPALTAPLTLVRTPCGNTLPLAHSDNCFL